MRVPVVSVVMGVFNGALYLPETVESVLSQDSVELEFIIVDDGSTDDTARLLARYASLDARIKVITQENQGLTRALIKGCAAASGKYVARQDVGDASHLRRLHLQVQALESDSDLAFVSCGTEFCGPQWESLYFVNGTGRSAAPTFIISDTERYGVIDGPTHHGSVMFDRMCYLKAGGYRAEFYYAQDWDLWHRLAEIGKFQTLEQCLYRARLMPGSISSHSKHLQKAIGDLSVAALKRRRRQLPEDDVLIQAGKIRPSGRWKLSAKHRAQWLYFIGECLRRRNDSRSSGYFRQSIRAYPLSVGAWFRLMQRWIQSR